MKGKTKVLTWIVLIVVVVGSVAGTMFFMGADFSKMFAPKKVTGLPSGCDATTTPSLTVQIQDRYSESLTAVNYAYRRDGGAWTTANGNTITIAGDPGSIIDIELAPDNTSFYGASKYGYEMPCSEVPEIQMDVVTVATNSMSSTVWNDDGTPNTATVAQALGAGEVKNIQVRLIGEYLKDYGDPFDGDANILVCPYNNTVFDSLNFAGLSTTDVPDQVSLASGNFYGAWKVPILHSNSDNAGSGFTYTASVDTDDSSGPTVLHNITCTLYDPQTYLDSTVGVTKYLTGVEDENNADVGIGTEETFTIYTS